MQKIQTGEGVAPGTAVTAVNSAISGDAFAADPTVPAGGGFTFDNTHAAHDVNAFKVVTGATSGNCLAFQTFTGAATVYYRIYVYVPATTGWGNVAFGVRLRGGGVQNARITFDATGHLVLRNGANSVLATGTVALALDTWLRVEGAVTQGAGGTGYVSVYTLDGRTVVDNLGTAASPISGAYGTANIDEFAIGMFTAGANQGPWWFDDTNVNDFALPGPLVTWIPPASRHRVIPQPPRRRRTVQPPLDQTPAPPRSRTPRPRPVSRPRRMPTMPPVPQVVPALLAAALRRTGRLIASLTRRRPRPAPIPQQQAPAVPARGRHSAPPRPRHQQAQTPLAAAAPAVQAAPGSLTSATSAATIAPATTAAAVTGTTTSTALTAATGSATLTSTTSSGKVVNTP